MESVFWSAESLNAQPLGNSSANVGKRFNGYGVESSLNLPSAASSLSR